MHYLVAVAIAAASWRLTVEHRWEPFWILLLGFLACLVVVELHDRRRDRARREAAYQKRKASRNDH